MCDLVSDSIRHDRGTSRTTDRPRTSPFCPNSPPYERCRFTLGQRQGLKATTPHFPPTFCSIYCSLGAGFITLPMVPHVVTGWTRHVRQMSMETGDQPTSGWCQFQSPMGPAWVQVGLVASCGGNLACSCCSTCLLSLSNYSHPRRPPIAIHG
jgi:hypothetical protein